MGNLTPSTLKKLTTPKPGPITTRLPGKFAKTNKALILYVESKASEASVQRNLDRAGRV